jgi:4-hydroxybenzoate polyprenyltransferase
MSFIGTLPAHMTALVVIKKYDAIFRICSFAFLRSYWITMRPYLLFVSGITGIAGLSFAPVLSLPITLLLGTVFFLSYGFGQALTDCFQMDTDALSSPYRPLSQGIIQREDILRVSLLGLVLSGIIVGLCSPVNIFLSTCAVLGLATYTYFKRRWWGGPWYNAWIVTVLCLIAYVAGVGCYQGEVVVSLPMLATFGVVFFGYANFVLTGYYKDISADRSTGYNTLPVRFGLRISTFVSHLLSVGALLSCGVALTLIIDVDDPVVRILPPLAFAAAGLCASGIAQFRLHRIRHEGEAHGAIVPVVYAYVLLLSSIAAAMKPGWIMALIVYYGVFVWTMRSRPVREQI